MTIQEASKSLLIKHLKDDYNVVGSSIRNNSIIVLIIKPSSTLDIREYEGYPIEYEVTGPFYAA